MSDGYLVDRKTLSDLNKAFVCTTLHISPREYDQLTLKDIQLVTAYLDARAERQKVERDLNKW